MRTLLVHQGEKPLIGILEDGQLAEVFFPQEGDTAEAVLLGRVERIVPGMKAAFVDIGQEKNGFLPLEEKNTGLSYPKTGDAVIVQIRKEAQGVKGAFLTRDISLCGETMLLTPMSRMIGVSSKITEDGKRKALKETGRAIAQERFGLVMRTAAENAPEEELAAEAERLFQQWEQIRRAAPTGIAPVQVIPENLLTIYKIESQLKEAQERRVWLSSGGTLVIDPCEAMTVIDVNTAKFTGKRELEDTVLRLNLEACGEIARQVRLRNLSGIIIIDMIDMKPPEHRQMVLDALEEAFASDRVKTVIHGLTSLGLVEMTRKRSRPPLREMLAKQEETHE